MNLHKIDLNLFPVFDAIVQTGSLTAAARELHLSQPAVSHALARLREHLGDALFVRQGRRMLPTPYARQLTPVVRHALSSLQAGVRSPQQGFVPETSDRVFTIGMRDILESLTMPGVMAGSMPWSTSPCPWRPRCNTPAWCWTSWWWWLPRITP
jgi:DNA-binding transcriptional LysR family regulator